MAVYRIPPVAQFQQPRAYADQRSVDVPIPQTPEPLQQLLWLRRRHDYEAEQQSRHLLAVDITATTVPPPLPTIEWLRRRFDYESEQQPRRLTDTSVSQSVDAPIPNSVPLELTIRTRWFYRQPGLLPVDILAPAVTPDNPTGAPYTQWEPRPPAWEQWLQARDVDTSYTQSVDSPPGHPGQQATVKQTFTTQQARLLSADLLAPIVTPDNPTGAPSFQWVGRPPAWEQWLQARPLPAIVTDGTVAPNALQGAAYARAAAATQAYRKVPSTLFLVTIESPPTQGPFQPAIYRRPIPPTPYRLPSTSVLVAPPVVPAPILNGTLTTTAVIDGRVATTATVDGQSSTTATTDGRTRTTQ
jgi:hypothetical protein